MGTFSECASFFAIICKKRNRIMAKFLSKCPHCKSDLELNDEWLGMEVQCPICSNSFKVTKKATPPPPLSGSANRTMNTPNSTNRTMNTSNSQPGHSGRQARFEDTQDPYDREEDRFVLDYLKKAKKWNFIWHLLECIVVVIFSIIWELPLLLSIPIIIGSYYFMKFVYSWCRGIYRNAIE